MSETRYNAPALEKGIDIIEFLSERSKPVSQKEVATALERTPSEIFRMLMTLVRRGYVRRDDDDRYTLTLRMFSLSQKHPPMDRLISAAIPEMHTLVQECWQSCHIAVEVADTIVIAASLPSPGNWGLMLRPGAVVGLTNASSGRVLAAFRSEAEAIKLLEAHRPAVGEVHMDRQEFLDRLEKIREAGEEIVPSDTTAGVTNMAFPVFDHTGRATAVVNCPYLKRLDDFDVPPMDVVAGRYRAFAQRLTEFYGGQRVE